MRRRRPGSDDDRHRAGCRDGRDTLTFNTQHVRLKAVNVLKWLAVELQFLNSADDTDTDSLGAQSVYDTGTTLAVRCRM